MLSKFLCLAALWNWALVFHGGNEGDCPRCPFLPRCPWNAPAEIYNFLHIYIGCPFPKEKMPRCPYPFKNESYRSAPGLDLLYMEAMTSVAPGVGLGRPTPFKVSHRLLRFSYASDLKGKRLCTKTKMDLPSQTKMKLSLPPCPLILPVQTLISFMKSICFT